MEIDIHGGEEFPFTAEWYKTREHAPHVDQWHHRPRMEAAAAMATRAVTQHGFRSLVDLGAGDGGLLSLLKRSLKGISAFDAVEGMWGYDLMSVNCDYARAVRMVDVRYLDFVDEPIDWGDLTTITECLEHLQYPHAMVRRIGMYSKAIVASSPSNETSESHDECHAWVWDMDGYRDLIEQGGFQVVEHELIEGGPCSFQVILGVMP
jgi:hypothetical protein